MNALLGKRTAVVLGAAELGSAVAVRLHEAGFAVVVCDEADPKGIRRGMSFIDAWYIGVASLADVRATFCGSIRSIPTVLAARRSVAATTWSWRGVAAHLAPSLIVDARQSCGRGLDLRGNAPPGTLTIGVAPRYRGGATAHAAVAVPRPRAPIGVAGAHRVLLATAGGRFYTARHIGEAVEAGDVVGGIGGRPVLAPAKGVLSGLAARGAQLGAGAPILEVDPRGDPVRCFLIPAACDGFARLVARYATEHGDPPGACGQAGAPHDTLPVLPA